jgi:hypothetical protein
VLGKARTGKHAPGDEGRHGDAEGRDWHRQMRPPDGSDLWRSFLRRFNAPVR